MLIQPTQKAARLISDVIAILINKTDLTGVANTSFTIGYDPSFIGTYLIYATTPFDNTALLDAVTFNVNG